MRRLLSTDARQSSTYRSARFCRGVQYAVAIFTILSMLILLVGTAAISNGQQAQRGIVVVASERGRKGAVPSAAVRTLGERENPRSGWLYVLDSNNMEPESQILLVDPEQGRVVRTFKAATAPDMALSPDGTRLYIASTKYRQDGNARKDSLKVIDTASGAILQVVNNPHRWISTGRQYLSKMALSPDGRWLYIFKHKGTADGDIYYLTTFDTARGRFLPEKVELPQCVTARLLPSSKEQQVYIICAGTSDVRFLNLTRTGAAVASTKSGIASLPSKVSLRSQEVAQHGRYIGPSFLSADGDILTIIMGDGRFFKIDSKFRKIIQTDVIDSNARKLTNSGAMAMIPSPDDWLAGRWIRFQTPDVSPDGTKLYLGTGRLTHLNLGVQLFDQIAVLDGETLERIGALNTSQSFYSLALSRDGRHLYTISPEQASITVMDTTTQREIRTIYGVGTSPIWAIVAP